MEFLMSILESKIEVAFGVYIVPLSTKELKVSLVFGQLPHLILIKRNKLALQCEQSRHSRYQ